jgi:hypothetical protein
LSLRRAFHDNLEDSRQNTILQNNLEHTIRFFLSIYVIPALRFNIDGAGIPIQRIKDTFRKKVVDRYSATSYSLGARYIEQLVNNKDNEKTSSVSTDVKELQSLNQKYNDQFWSLIDSYNNMQKTERDIRL